MHFALCQGGEGTVFEFHSLYFLVINMFEENIWRWGHFKRGTLGNSFSSGRCSSEAARWTILKQGRREPLFSLRCFPSLSLKWLICAVGIIDLVMQRFPLIRSNYSGSPWRYDSQEVSSPPTLLGWSHGLVSPEGGQIDEQVLITFGSAQLGWRARLHFLHVVI